VASSVPQPQVGYIANSGMWLNTTIGVSLDRPATSRWMKSSWSTPRWPSFSSARVLTSAMTCTPLMSKLYQPSPRLPAPNVARYFWPWSSTESCSPGTTNTFPVRRPPSIWWTWSNWAGVDRCVRSPVCMTKSGRKSSALTWSIAREKEPVTSRLAGPWKPMWLSLSWTNRSAFGSAAAVAPALPPTWLITSPPATVSTTAAPNQAPWRSSCRRFMPPGCPVPDSSRGALTGSPRRWRS